MSKKPETKKRSTSRQAEAALQADRQARATAFGIHLEKLKQKYGCGLVPTVEIVGSEMRTDVRIVVTR